MSALRSRRLEPCDLLVVSHPCVLAVNQASTANGSMLAVLRPEALSFADDGVPAWPGTVTARRFAGATSIYLVSLDGGASVEVATPSRVAAEGERVGVRVAREPVAVVPA